VARSIDGTEVVIIEDKKLRGSKEGWTTKDSNEIHVSPAMFKLLQSDWDTMSKSLKVKTVQKK
jgi:hypothetical protein